jgi:hypothetical protein
MNFIAWMKLVAQNRGTIFELIKEAFQTDWGKTPKAAVIPAAAASRNSPETELPRPSA